MYVEGRGYTVKKTSAKACFILDVATAIREVFGLELGLRLVQAI